MTTRVFADEELARLREFPEISVAFHMMLPGIHMSRRRLFADLLDDADGPRRARVRVDQLVFQR